MWDRKALGATYTGNCNWNQSDVPARRKHPSSASYCFLSEILFQNGLLAIYIVFLFMLMYDILILISDKFVGFERFFRSIAVGWISFSHLFCEVSELYLLRIHFLSISMYSALTPGDKKKRKKGTFLSSKKSPVLALHLLPCQFQVPGILYH